MTKDQEIEMLKAKLAEAVGLLREVNSQRFTTLATVEIIESFIGRHSQTFHDRAQAEQQKAQGAQAGDDLPRNLRSVIGMVLNALDRDAEDGKPARGEMATELRGALATQPAVPVAEHPVVKALLTVAAAAHLALEGTDSDGVDSTWDEADRENLDAAIEVLDRLPDDQPGFTMEPAAKAAWALRNLNAVPGAEHE